MTGSLLALGFTGLVINRDLLTEARLSRAQLAAAGFELRLAAGSRERFSIVR